MLTAPHFVTESGTGPPVAPELFTACGCVVTNPRLNHPDGSQSFEAFDKCQCHFDGHSGIVAIEAYGTTSADGATYGTFLVTSGGFGAGGLDTLAGYGTFSSYGEPSGTLRLVEHLGIT